MEYQNGKMLKWWYRKYVRKMTIHLKELNTENMFTIKDKAKKHIKYKTK